MVDLASEHDVRLARSQRRIGERSFLCRKHAIEHVGSLPGEGLDVDEEHEREQRRGEALVDDREPRPGEREHLVRAHGAKRTAAVREGVAPDAVEPATAKADRYRMESRV